MENEERTVEEIPSADAVNDAAAVAVDNAAAMEEMSRLEEQMILRQNMPKGIIASVIVGLACAALWAVITALTHYQIGYMAWGVGLAVGATMRAAGKGLSPVYGIIAAVIALLSCVIGNFLSYMAFLGADAGMAFGETLKAFDYKYTFVLFREMFHPMDALYYILAVSTAFSMGFIRNKDKAGV